MKYLTIIYLHIKTYETVMIFSREMKIYFFIEMKMQFSGKTPFFRFN